MFRVVLSLSLLLLPLSLAAADRLTMEIGTVSGPDWQAEGVVLHADTEGALHGSVRSLSAEMLSAPASLRIDCPPREWPMSGIRCVGGRMEAQLPGFGALVSAIDFDLRHAMHWQVVMRQLRAPGLALPEIVLRQHAGGLDAETVIGALDLARVVPIPLAMLEIEPAYTYSGQLSGSVRASRDTDGGIAGTYVLQVSGLDFSEPEGRHAGEALVLHAEGELEYAAQQLRLRTELGATDGQAYLEPVFNDFSARPVRAHLALSHDFPSGATDLESLDIHQTGVMQAQASGRLEAGALMPQQLRLRLIEGQLPELFDLYAQPFLAGSQLDPLTSSGRIAAALHVDNAELQTATIDFDQVSVDVGKLSLGIDELSGGVHWRASGEGEASRLKWSGGRLARLPLGAAGADFVLGGRDFRLTAPLRQPLLDGALVVQRLSLRNIGAPDLGAEFGAEIEPIDLRLLSETLGWPEFSGRLAGRIPSLRLEDGSLELDGALTAQAFDGEITLSNLRVLDAFSVVPRIAADIRMRNLDLLALTGAFAFGSIEGRMDGDVVGLRLLGGEPVAFDAHFYTTPGDRSRHRISQRAIDNISAVGGGPSGILSSGVLRFFSDFPYRRVGWRCRLRNNICHMDGAAPAPNGGYYLVQGKWLPRIDVIGHGRRVDWSTFMAQLQNVRMDED